MNIKEMIKKHGERESERSVNRNMFELHEADARVRHFRQGYDLLAPLLEMACEALEFECGNRCAHQNLCNARETLEAIKAKLEGVND